MRTNTPTNTKAKAARKSPNTNTERSGITTTSKIPVTIDGLLAEQIRKEAQETGMSPLSLVRQRIKLGNLLTQESDEAKEFRMDIAERAFLEAGKQHPTLGGKSEDSTVPDNCIMARVRPEDALWIANRAKHYDQTAPWIIAGVLAEAGEGVLRSHRLGRQDNSPETLLRKPTAQQLWTVINRDPEDFTESVPVMISETERCAMEVDAGQMARELGDWVGTLIMMGIEMVEADSNLTFMIEWRGFSLLASRIEHCAMREGGCE
jgi:hypothetical protein